MAEERNVMNSSSSFQKGLTRWQQFSFQKKRVHDSVASGKAICRFLLAKLTITMNEILPALLLFLSNGSTVACFLHQEIEGPLFTTLGEAICQVDVNYARSRSTLFLTTLSHTEHAPRLLGMQFPI